MLVSSSAQDGETDDSSTSPLSPRSKLSLAHEDDNIINDGDNDDDDDDSNPILNTSTSLHDNSSV